MASFSPASPAFILTSFPQVLSPLLFPTQTLRSRLEGRLRVPMLGPRCPALLTVALLSDQAFQTSSLCCAPQAAGSACLSSAGGPHHRGPAPHTGGTCRNSTRMFQPRSLEETSFGGNLTLHLVPASGWSVKKRLTSCYLSFPLPDPDIMVFISQGLINICTEL